VTVIDFENYKKRKKIKRPNINFDILESPYDINVKYGTGDFQIDSHELAIQRLDWEGFIHDSE